MTLNVTTATDNVVLEDAGAGKFNAIIRGRQEITDEFLRENAELRTLDGQKFRKNQDAVMAVRIPETLFNHWCRQGFNILADKNITVNTIMARLRAEGHEQFITTNKRF